MTTKAIRLPRGSGSTSARVLKSLDRWDARAFGWVARRRSPGLDDVMPKLSRVADRSVLWMAVSGALLAAPSRQAHLAARRGMLTVAVTSGVTNLVAKQILRRPRPVGQLAASGQPMVRMPRSTSFPSGHSASAAAFALSVGMSQPAIALPLAGLASGVAYSRVYTKVHYPSDVVAGLALGGLIAVAVRAVAPTTPQDPVRVLNPVPAPQEPRPDGAGVVVIVNPNSGGGEGARLARDVERDLPAAEIVETKPGEDLMVTLRAAADRAQVLGICGGDGSVNAAAQVAMERDLPLFVLPGGTFNHFAGDLGFSDAAEAIQAVQAGTAARVDVGTVTDRTTRDEQIFLNTASLGSYPAFVINRERWESRFGKGLSAVIALAMLREEEPLNADIDGRAHRLALMFIGNGRYQPHGFAPSWRPRMDEGLLDIRLLDVATRFFIPRLVGAIISGRLSRSPFYSEHTADSCSVEMPGGPTSLARDGEVGPGGASLRFGVKPGALNVYQPCGGRPDSEPVRRRWPWTRGAGNGPNSA